MENYKLLLDKLHFLETENSRLKTSLTEKDLLLTQKENEIKEMALQIQVRMNVEVFKRKFWQF